MYSLNDIFAVRCFQYAMFSQCDVFTVRCFRREVFDHYVFAATFQRKPVITCNAKNIRKFHNAL